MGRWLGYHMLSVHITYYTRSLIEHTNHVAVLSHKLAEEKEHVGRSASGEL